MLNITSFSLKSFGFKSFVQTAMLAAAMFLGASPAIAGPVYHVSINTAGVTATTGLLDFSFLGTTDADVSTLTLSNFSGMFGAEEGRSGAVTDTATGYTMSTSVAGQAFLTRAVTLGGNFGFDVEFADSYTGADLIAFTVSLYSDGFAGYLGVQGPLVQFDLYPAAGAMPSFVVALEDNALADISEVPEPSDLLLMLTALAMLGFVARRGRKSL